MSMYVKLTFQTAPKEANKICSVLMLVVLVKKQSEEILKLLMNLQMIRQSSFIMD